MNTCGLAKIHFFEGELPDSNPKKFFSVLDDEKFGTKNKEDLIDIVKKIESDGSECQEK